MMLVDDAGSICEPCQFKAHSVPHSNSSFCINQQVVAYLFNQLWYTNEEPAQQDGVSQEARSHATQEFNVTYFFHPLEITSACQCDRWLCCSSRWFRTIVPTSLKTTIFANIWECGFFCDNYSGLTGVDWSVVCPLVELICLWGCCSDLSKALSLMDVDFGTH